MSFVCLFFFQAEDGIRDLVRSRGLGDVYKRQSQTIDRAAVLIDTVKQGDVVREVRGNGTLAPERIRWITAQALSLIHI